MTAYPTFRPVADRAVLVEFGTEIAAEIHGQVLRLDRLLTQSPPLGMAEAVPAYANLLVTFDPLVTDHTTMIAALHDRLDGPDLPANPPRHHDLGVCYDPDLGSDLVTVAEQTGLSVDAVVNAHIAAEYSVYLYGFAPGYAYLAGTPPSLQLPRKPAAIRDIPAGRVIIAGPQCIVTTLKMPTGWWILGACPTRILRDDPARPFLFDVGDTVRFHRISRAAYDADGAR
ncbi:MAG: allophanate hydrolase subunit 1 [bacterium]